MLAALLGGASLASEPSQPEPIDVADRADFVPPEPGTYSLPVIRVPQDGWVLDSKGARHRLREFTTDGLTVMSFIYTRCSAMRACPYATGVLREVQSVVARETALAGHVRLVSLSFDPENDTPARMADYAAWVRERDLPVPWEFLTTPSVKDLRPILETYGQVVDRRADPNDPRGPLFHTLRVYLIDARGRIRNIYGSDTLDPRLVIADLKSLLLDDPSQTLAVPGANDGHALDRASHGTAKRDTVR